VSPGAADLTDFVQILGHWMNVVGEVARAPNGLEALAQVMGGAAIGGNTQSGCAGRTIMTRPMPPVRSKVRRIARELLAIAAFALVLMSARSSLADHYSVPTGSMLPTIELDDRIIVNKAAYGVHIPFTSTYVARFDGPKLGDVVVLDSPEEAKVLLKRVVGTPGARIEVRDGRILIDDKLAPLEQHPDGLHERLGGAVHQIRLTGGGGPDYGPITIPEGRYLVMGDNRGDSHDGRSFGLVSREAILGRATGVFWRGGPTWSEL
jgi:signal peptidase I